MAKEPINPAGVHRPRGYTHAIKAGNTIWVSGQVALDEEHKAMCQGDMAGQTEIAYDHLKKVLEAAGASMKDVVKLNFYLTDMEAFHKETRDIRRKYFGNYRPAATAVEVTRLYVQGLLIEIEAVAVVD